MLLPEIIKSSARKTPDKIALVWKQFHWNYREYLDNVEQLAKALHAHGIRHGDRVALF